MLSVVKPRVIRRIVTYHYTIQMAVWTVAVKEIVINHTNG